MFILFLLSCISQPAGKVINVWLEASVDPIYEQALSSYGDWCVIFSQNREAYMLSDGYGLEGPYPWDALNENTIEFSDFRLRLEAITASSWDLRLTWLPWGLNIYGVGYPCSSFTSRNDLEPLALDEFL